MYFFKKKVFTKKLCTFLKKKYLQKIIDNQLLYYKYMYHNLMLNYFQDLK